MRPTLRTALVLLLALAAVAAAHDAWDAGHAAGAAAAATMANRFAMYAAAEAPCCERTVTRGASADADTVLVAGARPANAGRPRW